MGDTLKADRDKLPSTGVDPEWELELSSIFIEASTKMVREEKHVSITLLSTIIEKTWNLNSSVCHTGALWNEKHGCIICKSRWRGNFL